MGVKRVLLTGIGGAIGVHVLAHIMHKTDWEVVGIDSFNHHGHYDRVVEMCRTHPDWVPRVTVISHDLTTPFTGREIDQLGQIDYILNLASLVVVGESVDSPKPFIRNNINLTLEVLDLALQLKPSVFLQFSTDEVYGPAADEPHKEWAPLVPSNPYAASKGAQELIAISYWRSYGLPLAITNCTNNFGEMAGGAKFSALVQKKVRKGEVVTIHASDGEIGSRYYIHSRNTADAVLFILQNTTPSLHEPGKSDRPDRYNIVGDKRVNNLELAHTIAELMGKELHAKIVNHLSEQPGHDLHYGLDGGKLAELGWKAPKTFEESLKSTIEWQSANPSWV